jgi:hypothetical protein
LAGAQFQDFPINLFALVFGFDAYEPAIKLPLAGRIGL